jgi:hypothetical protein
MPPTASIPTETLALYDKVVAALPGVERKGAAMPYTSLNGHMFSFITKEGRLALRLSEGEREAFLKKNKDAVCVQNGVVMKEYVTIPDAQLKKSSDLRKHFESSLAYVGSLKPKATTKKPAAKKKVAKKTKK